MKDGNSEGRALDYMRDVPGSESFIRFARERLGEDFAAADATGVWGNAWMRYLGEDGAVFYKMLGKETIPILYNKGLHFHGALLVTLEYDGADFVILRRDLGMDGFSHWVLHGPGGEEKTLEFIKEMLSRERDAKELHMWGSREIPLDKLDTKNFVSPSYVEEMFSKEVYPQLDGPEIFNHVLLYSYPGVGKTAFCRVLAKKYPEWQTVVVTPHMVEKPRHIQNAFDYAVYRTPAILIFEDIDTWAQSRYEDASMKEDFSPYLGALLNCVDGVETHQELLVIATTNNPESLDAAIIRPGRFGIKSEFRYNRDELIQVSNNYLGEKHGKAFYAPILRNTPAHLRALMKTARAYAKLERVEIDQTLLKDIDKMLKKSPKLPKLQDMFIGDDKESILREVA